MIDGVAQVSVTIPADAADGATALTLVAQPSGTTVTLPLTIEGSSGPEVGTTTVLRLSPTTVSSWNPWRPIYGFVTVRASDQSKVSGTVEVRSGDELVAQVKVRNGLGFTVLWPSLLGSGTHEVTATFIPDSAQIGGSTSEPVTVTVR